MQIRTILCPIDFSDVSASELDVAVEAAQAFDARLVLHHNRAAISPGLARQWDWESTHCAEHYTDAQARRRMQDILNALPSGIDVEGVVSAGPIGTIVLALAQRLPADLVVLGSHGWSTPDHASVTERVVRQAPCAVLTFDEGVAAPQCFRLRASEKEDDPVRATVPTDFSATAQHAVDYACGLARAQPRLRLDLVHVVSATQGRSDDAVRAARERLEAAVPADLTDRVETQVRSGEAVDQILSHLGETRPSFAVLGEHARDLFRRAFTRDTTQAVMHASPCPVWIVPARVTA